MAVTVTKVTGANSVFGNKRVKIVDLAFTSTYPDGGEALAASAVGLKKIDFAVFSGPALSTDRETANEVSYDFVNSKVVMFESGGANAASAEKTDSEAHATGSAVRAMFVGY
jgi:hypothetical protein